MSDGADIVGEPGVFEVGYPCMIIRISNGKSKMYTVCC